MKLRPEEALARRQARLARRRQEEVLARRRILPVWGLAVERNGVPAVKIFVHDDEVQCLRLDRIVQKHSGGYAAYRPGEAEPFLVAKDLKSAFGYEVEVKSFWKGNP